MIQQNHYKYIVVGGGISGLRAAENLSKMGESFIVLEATNRFGGKICTVDIKQVIEEDKIQEQYPWLNGVKDVEIEIGATWVCDSHHEMKSILATHGVSDVPQFYEGKKVCAVSKNDIRAVDHGSEFLAPYKEKIVNFLHFIEKEKNRYFKLISDKKSGNFTEQQEQELKDFYKKYDTMLASDFIRDFVQDQELAHIIDEQVLVLQSIQTKYISTITLMLEEGHLDNLAYFTGVMKDCIDGNRVRGGMRTVLKAIENSIIKELKARNIDPETHLLKSHVVKSIHNTQNPVRVVVENGKEFTCQKVILCLPRGTVKFIKFDQLSQGKRIVVQNQLHSTVTRTAMIFKKPFWRELGYSGNASFYHEYHMRQLVELTPEDKSCGIVAFVYFKQGIAKWNSEIEEQLKEFNLQGEQLRRKRYHLQKEKAKQIIADLFLKGDTKSEHLQEFIMFARCRSDVPYLRDTYNATLAPEAMLKINEANEDHKDPYGSDELNVIFLGSDFSEENPGYMEGAVRVAKKKINADYLSK